MFWNKFFLINNFFIDISVYDDFKYGFIFMVGAIDGF